jgi:uncharacterized membrane protein
MSATGTQAQQELATGLKLVLPGRGLPLGAGWDWVVKGWALFARAPLMWIVAIVVLVVISIVMAFIPVLGQLVMQVAQPVFAAGFVVACRSLEKGGDFELEHLFAGFTRRFGPLAIVGVIFLIGGLVILALFFVIAGFSLVPAFMSGDPMAIQEAFMDPGTLLMIALAGLVAAGLLVPLMAAYWFAPPLVVMHDMPPIAAMKASFGACLRNFFTFFVYGLVMMVAAVIAVIPLGLGMLVWVPVMLTSNYVAYRQIFTADA